MTHTDGATALALVPALPSLDEALDIYGAETETEEQRATFVIDTDEKANWAARKLRKLEDQMHEQNALARAEIERVNEWHVSVSDALERDAKFFTDSLVHFHAMNIRAALAEQPDWEKVKGKSKKLLHGVTLASRKPTDTWNFDDETFIKWADEHVPDAVRRKPAPAAEVDVNAAKSALTVTPDLTVIGPRGVVAEGVTVTRAEPTHSVKIGK